MAESTPIYLMVAEEQGETGASQDPTVGYTYSDITSHLDPTLYEGCTNFVLYQQFFLSFSSSLGTKPFTYKSLGVGWGEKSSSKLLQGVKKAPCYKTMNLR